MFMGNIKWHREFRLQLPHEANYTKLKFSNFWRIRIQAQTANSQHYCIAGPLLFLLCLLYLLLMLLLLALVLLLLLLVLLLLLLLVLLLVLCWCCCCCCCCGCSCCCCNCWLLLLPPPVASSSSSWWCWLFRFRGLRFLLSEVEQPSDLNFPQTVLFRLFQLGYVLCVSSSSSLWVFVLVSVWLVGSLVGLVFARSLAKFLSHPH